MKQTKKDKIIASLGTIFIAVTLFGLIVLFLLQQNTVIITSFYTYLGWVVFCAIAYAFANHSKEKNSSNFDFYSVAEPVGRQARRKKQNIEERVAIHIDQDGLDPMVLFNEEKSGVACILKIGNLPLNHKLTQRLSQLGITTKQLGHPIEKQTLLEMNYEEEQGYCRITTGETLEKVELAFLESGKLYDQVSHSIKLLIDETPKIVVSKIDVHNFQAMVKFYNYVKRLTAEENRSVEYISTYLGTLKICNSSYVALYDCTLQSTLTSWVNKQGLIRTDNVDVELETNNPLHLLDIELPYPECRLVNIQVVKADVPQDAVKLYFSLAELDAGELTGKVSGLSLLMEENSISIRRDEQFDTDLISVEQYFANKSYPEF